MIFKRTPLSNISRLAILTEAENPNAALAAALPVRPAVLLSPVYYGLFERAAGRAGVSIEAYAQELLEDALHQVIADRLTVLEGIEAKAQQRGGGSHQKGLEGQGAA